MTPLMIYLLKVNGIFILLFLFYQLMLRRDTFYGAKRIFLMAIVILSLVLPLLHVANLIPQRQSIRYIVILLDSSLPTTAGMSIVQWIDMSLWAGMAATLVILLFRYTILLQAIRDCRIAKLCGQTVYIPRKEVNPFSFNGRIYLNPELYDNEESAKIIAHEQAHIEQHHGMDLTVISFFRLFVWMNPVFYWFANAVRENVEFLADKTVLKAGNDPKAYQYALLKVTQATALPLTQHFNMSHLKKRIIMMNKKRTHTVWTSKYLMAIPLLMITILLANAGELKEAWTNADFSSNSRPESNTIPADSAKQAKHEVIVIRHQGDSAQAKPLIIVDGKRVTEEEMKQIDPETINQVEVFKDSMSVSKFGKEGKNGVVVITSKSNGNTTTTIKNNDHKTVYVSTQTNPNSSGAETVTTTVCTDNQNSKVNKTITINASTENGNPLVILDGKVFDSNISTIDKNTIESVSILKDASAIKLYGNKGKNGVIIITSKKN